jgi:sugar phosphate isomerase/epimerase
MPPTSLSTMWLQHRFNRLTPFFEAGTEMGFETFELSHILFPAFFESVDPRAYTVAAVHDPCPRPPEGPGQLSTLDDGLHQRALDALRVSIDTAVEFGATAVVLHAGRVDGIDQPERELRDMHRRGEYGTSAYAAARRRLIDAREERAAVHLDAVRRGLQAAVDYASERGIRIGLENRVNYHEIPSFEELRALLADFPAETLGFWYDTGHARVLHNLGFDEYLAWPQAFGERLIGIHFHDVGGLRDHLLPGMAEIDFAAVAPHLPPEAVRTCEFDWHFAPVAIRDAVEYLAETGCLSDNKRQRNRSVSS